MVAVVVVGGTTAMMYLGIQIHRSSTLDEIELAGRHTLLGLLQWR